ncbi:hypothetical protein OHS70_04050 [Streptomyces sp. NBC_00390]|uniref:methyltransferase family protein n=1 Tax=Streptomyces sp. NBC_00390 TaxID=2975736 RepID=UPI002E1F8BE8
MTQTSPDVSTSAGIIRLSNAFCDAKALLTAVELDLFTTLHNKGTSTEEEIRKELGLHGRGLSDWLNLLTALGLLERSDGGYRNAKGADRRGAGGGGGCLAPRRGPGHRGTAHPGGSTRANWVGDGATDR